MYVRWQSRKKTRPMFFGRGATGDVYWGAVLVESIRIDGRPTQKHIASLTYIYESSLTNSSSNCSIVERAEFWDRLTKRLDRLGNRVSADDRKKIETAIALKVDRPTKKEREDADRRVAKILADMGPDRPVRRRRAF
jgi:hypothetical protein